MNPIIEHLQAHCSIRKFTDQPVSESDRYSIIRSGQAAPTSSFVQAYSIVRVTEKQKREQIAQAAGGQKWVMEAPEFWVLCADLSRIQYSGEQYEQADLAGHTEHFIVATVDVALMAQNMMTAAEALGLGGVFIGGIRNDPQLVSDLLGLPDLVYPVFGFCIGHPDQTVAVKPRMPAQAVLHTDQYDVNRVADVVAEYDQEMEQYYASRGLNQRQSNWSKQTVGAVHGKLREHMLSFLQARGFLKQ